MDQFRRRAMLLLCMFALAAAPGCATNNQMAPRAPFVRSQHLCATASPGSVDAAAVKQDLGALLAYIPTGVSVQYLKPYDANVSRIGALTAGAKNPQSYSHKDGQLLYLSLATIQVTDDRVTVSNALSFGYEEMMDSEVGVSDKTFDSTRPNTVEIGGVMRLGFANRELAQCVAEEFRLLQLPLRTQEQEQALAVFQTVADRYRAMPAKPQVSEEQRRFIVQANALTQKKEFAKANALYEKALEVNPFSYPAAHYNMALISAQQGRYTAAITSMKKYLMLMPDAEDARTAQDKIYEWEALGGGR